ncbi:MAG: tRNA lysidine(34) synthetase TilS [Hyphomicrobiales bacterium]|nr:tRNA lysidine(34) synthetase TilS [Hyphomicrobiales bacterium]
MASADDLPVSPAEALDAFRPTLGRRGVALAVSGGADSLSLLHLWADARDLDARLPRAVALSVDHRLRPEAAREAAFVGEVAAARGLEHRILAWEGDKPSGNLQAAARDARRRLMREAMRDLDLDTLLLAHHADDQAETFLLRLARGSGVLGLAAMAAWREADGVALFRPFLAWPKARLVATLRACGATWIEDPSNGDVRFERARWRRAMPVLAELGLDRERLTATAAAMARASRALERSVDAFVATAVTVHPAGFASLSASSHAAAEEEIRLRFLARAITALGGADYGPRLSALTSLDADLIGGATATRTLGAVLIERRRGRLWFAPEAGRSATLRLAPGETGRLGGRRFGLSSAAEHAVTIAPLGERGRRAWARSRPAEADDAARPSAALLEGLPAVHLGERLVGCPGLFGETEIEALGLEVGEPPNFAGGTVR